MDPRRRKLLMQLGFSECCKELIWPIPGPHTLPTHANFARDVRVGAHRRHKSMLVRISTGSVVVAATKRSRVEDFKDVDMFANAIHRCTTKRRPT